MVVRMDAESLEKQHIIKISCHASQLIKNINRQRKLIEQKSYRLKVLILSLKQKLIVDHGDETGKTCRSLSVVLKTI